MKISSMWSVRHKLSIFCVGIVVVALLGGCVFFGISRPRDLDAYIGMASECHPIWKQFALRRFRADDSAAELFGQFPPDRREEFGRYGRYSYFLDPGGLHFTGLIVTTRDGKLLTAAAGSCTWQHSFFHVDDTEIDGAYSNYLHQKFPDIYGVKKP